MLGISSVGKDKIAAAIGEMFDRLSINLLGNIPALRNKKVAMFATQEFNLASLFVAAMKNKSLNPVETDVLKGMLSTAHGYVESLKARTTSNVTDQIDAAIREAKAKKTSIGVERIQAIIAEEMKKAKAHIKAITESESTKARNLGVAMDISRVAAELGDQDPTVYFVIVRDNKVCSECMRLHMMPDGVTPRLWKLSQLKQSYGKRGDEAPSLVNRHPHCRCSLVYLTKGFGFNAKGYMTYKHQNYDAIAHQNA